MGMGKQLIEVAKPNHVGGALSDSDDDEDVVVTDVEMDVSDHVPVRGIRTLQDVYERCSLVVTEPTSSIEARSIDVWRKAMLQELSLIEKNKTWKLADLPRNKKAIGVKWVFRTKLNPNASICKYKARLVVKSYSQHYV